MTKYIIKVTISFEFSVIIHQKVFCLFVSEGRWSMAPSYGKWFLFVKLLFLWPTVNFAPNYYLPTNVASGILSFLFDMGLFEVLIPSGCITCSR